MKKVAVASIILLLIVIAWFEFTRFKKYNPPAQYEYIFDQGVDVHYHDQELVKLYFQQARTASTLGNEMWNTYGIDVKAPDAENSIAMNAAYEYTSLLGSVDYMGQKLLQSAKWKEQGFSNEEIKQMENEGISPAGLKFRKFSGGGTLKFGDSNSSVWELQVLLNKKGFTIPMDGVFQIETETALKEYQTKNNLFPSGMAGLPTIEMLLK